MMSNRSHYIPLLFGTLLLLASCASRYRLDLFMNLGGEASKVKVESARSIPNARLGNPYGDNKLLPGDHTALIIRTSKWEQSESDSQSTKAVQIDESLRTEIYVEVDTPPIVGSLPLADRSFVLILERFDQTAEEKIFLPESGTVTIDSITSKYIFVSLDGSYANLAHESLSLSGSARVNRHKP